MKKINGNFFVFIMCLGIIFAGAFSKTFFNSIFQCTKTFFADINSVGIFNAFDIFTNTRVVEKEDSTVTKTPSNYLANPRPYVETAELYERADRLKGIAEATKANGAEFLYVMAPCKGYNMPYPSNISDFTKSNCDRFAACLKDKQIPTLNLIETMQKQGITEEDAFFITDHHWKPDYAFKAVGEICDYLKTNYGFNYDAKNTDISNFSVTTYENWFLGSQGKKVGSYFTNFGPDDINIILPDFETSFSEEQPIKNHKREGNFAETVMYMENVAEKDLYSLNPYAAYSGGDFREQIITNYNNPDGNTILLIRDSFGCAAAPFLALNSHKLYVTDVRDYEYYVGDKINVYDYIEKINPDYVIVLYNGVSSGADLFDFD